jgi:aspartyl-tRNA(Asn)/glutamyl-tRNA(Gln) amidotransferase subunit B
VHLEEDTGKLVHAGDKLHRSWESYVDLNRAGVPLMEIVSEPDIRSADEARDYAMELQRVLRYVGASDADMEKGQMRAEPNVSVRRAGSQDFGVKTELKNINSFRALHRAIGFEVERQIELIESGGAVVQETRGWSEAEARTFSQRSKEFAEDYRYFPEPDLVPLVPTEEMLGAARAALPELPAARAERFERDFGLPASRARELAFRTDLADYFEQALASDGAELDPLALANWIPQLVERIGADVDPASTRVSPASLASLVKLVSAKTVSRETAREVLTRLVADGGDPATIVEREGLGALDAHDSGLAEIVAAAIASDPDAAEKVRGGNMKASGPLVGYVMRETKGRADGGEVARLIREQLVLA